MVSIFLLFLFELSDQTVLATRSYSYLRECVLQGEQRLTNNNNNRQRSRQLTNADIVPILNFQTCILTHLHTTCMYTTHYILHTSDFKSACWQTSGLKTGHSLILSFVGRRYNRGGRITLVEPSLRKNIVNLRESGLQSTTEILGEDFSIALHSDHLRCFHIVH